MRYFDENEGGFFFIQNSQNAIIEISDLLGIDSKNITYDSKLKVFFIGLDETLNKIDIHELDDEIFTSQAIAFRNCHFHCKIELNKKEFTHRIIFLDCVFDEEINIDNSIFNEPFDIIDCTIYQNIFLDSTTFKKPATIRTNKTSKDKKIVFNHLHFHCDLRMSGVFDCLIEFSNITFEANFCCSEPYGEIAITKRTYFNNSIYLFNTICKGILQLNDCNFKYLSIHENKNNHIVLDHSTLENTNFCGSSFKTISLINAKFLSFPLMFGCIFEQEINLTNTAFPTSFEDVAKSAEYFEEEKSQYGYDTLFPEYLETYTIVDFFAKNRDIFRKIKYLLLKENNNLDASTYHRAELYCRELELYSKPDKKLQDKIDKWQLWFYRQTSEHHTDLLRSFHTLIALIGIFGFLCGSVVLGLDYFVFDYQKGFDILQLKSFFFEKIDKSITSHLLEYFVGNIVLVFVFLGLFLGVMWECSREILIPLGYIATFGFLATSPKYLIPAMSLFGEKWVALNPLGTIGGIYTLLFGFLAYSFIKTARKNSIVPS